jgi:hypothetical protein
MTGSQRIVRWLYVLTMIGMGFTGLGQMPIFKRYYIADIPGMAWAADFYLTHYIHYLGAIFLFALIAYAILDYILLGRKAFHLTASAYLRIALLGGIVVTGIFRVFKNFPDVVFSPDFTLLIDISHLGFMMAYIFSALFFMFIKSGWVVRKSY